MERFKMNLVQMKNIAKLGYKLETKVGILIDPKGSKGSAHLTIMTLAENTILLNISDAVTYMFTSEEKLNKFLNKYFTEYESDKDMWMNYYHMDEETWNEWNA